MPTSSDSPTAGPPPEKQPDRLEDYVPDHGLPKLSRLNVALLVMSILAMCAALYLSPMGQHATQDARRSVADTIPGTSDLLSVTKPSASPSASATSPATADATPTTPSTPSAKASGVLATSASPQRPWPTGSGSGSGSGSSSSGSSSPGGSTQSTHQSTHHSAHHGTRHSAHHQVSSSSSGTHGATPTATSHAKTHCWDFTWQQDAQAAYLANLSDPYGLDGAVGPYNGDGLACTQLPVDPSRAASTPVAAYVAPTPTIATKEALVHPTHDYFGFSQDGVPGDATMVKDLATKADKAPSSVGWFSTFDDSYRADLVGKAWQAGELPVVTWMPVDDGSGNSYSATHIISGEWDSYLRRYAGDIVRQNQPVVIRFAHEMNGNWYGWSAGQTAWNNSPAKYIAAWRHIWDIFQDVGANQDVIWLWSPNRVDSVVPSATNGQTNIADDYPGDKYVDWVGASVYMRYASEGPSYQTSFGKTVAALEAVTDKPIFFAETAAVQSDSGVDLSAVKTEWIHNVLSEFAADPRIVGFLWFNNVAKIEVNGLPVTNDWRVDSTAASLKAFQDEIASPAYASGVLPD